MRACVQRSVNNQLAILQVPCCPAVDLPEEADEQSWALGSLNLFNS